MFVRTVKFLINAMYMGGVPLAEHDNAASKTILGGTSKVMFKFS